MNSRLFIVRIMVFGVPRAKSMGFKCLRLQWLVIKGGLLGCKGSRFMFETLQSEVLGVVDVRVECSMVLGFGCKDLDS